MVSQVNYYQCNCGQGRLEVIAKTQYQEGRPSLQDAYTSEGWPNTFFLKCSTCNQLYEAAGDEHLSAGPIPGITGEHMIQSYTGRLSESQIRTYVPQHRGQFKQVDEDRILSQ